MEIDPVEFGELKAEVASLRRDIDELGADVKSLLEMANKGKGALWAYLGAGSIVGAALSWFASHLGRGG